MYSPSGFDASNFVSSFNTSFYLMLAISLLFLIGLTVTMIFFVFRYNRKKNKTATQIHGSTSLEVIWTVIPILLALLMFHFGWRGWTPMNKPPKDALKITSVARMWNFTFIYENGKQSPDLIIPVGTAVNIKLTSLDVLHSLYIPEFRIKSDMIPGREKHMWFRSDREGEYQLFCAEYCGLRHSYMNSKVQVLAKDAFDEWYKNTAPLADSAATPGPGAEGAALIKTNGCNACHSVDGSKIVGPTFKGLFGKQITVVSNGKETNVTADEEYIKRSIYDPNAEIVKGYPQGLMQSYKATLNDNDISKIIEYFKSLNEN
ncbi:MAG TPA: cytochrome c oxidase subunit II [Bacteroidales bacterium]|jgi:cytochrome c oxidase subunit 2|nr:cytochrome c oxidase subunit II [Bacteroidales bacterium]